MDDARVRVTDQRLIPGLAAPDTAFLDARDFEAEVARPWHGLGHHFHVLTHERQALFEI